jgi:HPt (histidine-containing phosphotransfer) domain-containing protein
MHRDSPDQVWTLPHSLQELAAEGCDDLVREVLSVFRTDTTDRLVVLRRALSAGDRPQIRSQAHALKGSSAQVAANALMAACSELEQVAPSAEMHDLADLVNRTEGLFFAVRDAISRQYGA